MTTKQLCNDPEQTNGGLDRQVACCQQQQARVLVETVVVVVG